MKKTRILVIDDAAGMRFLIREMLEAEGYEVSEAEDGDEGIKLYHENPVDLVITDIIMPNESGISVIDKLKSACPAIKIIAISGGSAGDQQSFLRMAKVLGAVSTIQKPLKAEGLLAVVEKALAI